ncbi:hypothetical protein [Kitasatospora sp. NBC_01266]|uniref:hypothetical protein n=1 Tax=Kitasatospora sp. NBC_01266 TaxID=2903572 RepID=UPI002E3758DE|nr:hypothetical protein [Kitasatospora sp. NBC_01266]
MSAQDADDDALFQTLATLSAARAMAEAAPTGSLPHNLATGAVNNLADRLRDQHGGQPEE